MVKNDLSARDSAVALLGAASQFDSAYASLRMTRAGDE